MTTTSEAVETVQNLPFQAQVRELLRLVAHSLYSHPEIFLRELISNASDACDKLRFEASQNPALFEGDGELKIWVDYDKAARTVTVRDNGIGMTLAEAIEHLGTVAKSGTRAFLQRLNEEARASSQLIGQFGVGFYSAFIVADRVVVRSRKAGMSASAGVEWHCEVQEGAPEGFSVRPIERPERGTEVVLHLKEDAAEFASRWRLSELIHKYSEHILWPILMPKEEWDKDKGEYRRLEEWEQVNRASALWTRPKSEISEEEYRNFYRHVAHDPFGEPLAWLHTKIEGKQDYTLLLYLPKRAPFDLWDRKPQHGIKLYVKRVFIMEDAERLLPHYLRFVRGVVDAADLPLNVSREMLQEAKALDSLRAGITKRVLGWLEQLAKNEPERYAEFWREFGRVLKEGIGEDPANREKIAALLRFATTVSGGPDPTVSLDTYLGRMKEGQDKIYYVVADSYAAAANSPHLERLRQKGIEVLLLWDRIDEWWTAHLPEYQGKPLVNVALGDEALEALSEEEKQALTEVSKTHEALLERFQKALAGKVKTVRVSSRLTDSPSCLVTDGGMSLHLARLLAAAGQEAPKIEPVLELNVTHPLVQRAAAETDDTAFAEWAQLLFEEAQLAEGATLEDPMGFVKRINRFLVG